MTLIKCQHSKIAINLESILKKGGNIVICNNLNYLKDIIRCMKMLLNLVK